MFIPGPRFWFFSIPDPDNKKKDEGGNFEIGSLILFGAKNFTNYFIFELLQKKFEPNYKEFKYF